MLAQQDPRLQSAAIRARYNDPAKYSSTDPWHRFTAASVRREVAQAAISFSHSCERILNAGAGGNDLGLPSSSIINLDISEMRLLQMAHSVVASIEMLPFAEASMDAIICVGSVINYCDAAVVISEFSRVLRPRGYLILDFDSSDSAEFMRHAVYKRSAGIVETFYAGEQEILWLYSPRYISNLLTASKFHRLLTVPIHVLSPWILLLFHNLKFAATIARLDFLARHFPLLARFSSNHLFVCQKHI